MSDIDQQLYQQLILEHNRKPRNFGAMTDHTHFAEGFNPLCGDRYNVFVRMNDQGLIDAVSFEGHGCAISKASASLMTESIKGKTLDEANLLFDDFRELLKRTEGTGEVSERLGKLRIFSGIWKYPARVKCAALSWHAMHAALAKEARVSTE